MSAKSIVIAVAVAGWFLASLVAFVIVVLFGFLGVGLIGVVIAFVATQFELESGGVAPSAYGASMLRHQVEAQRQMSAEQRAARRDDQSVTAHAARFFRHFGIGLALIGFGGFACLYL